MNVVKLSDFVSDYSCRYDENQMPIISKKFLTKNHLVDSIENDTTLFDLYGTLYIFRSYFMLLNGTIVQKVLERCMSFMSENPHANPHYMFKSVMRKKNDTGNLVTNNYRNDNSVRTVNINLIIDYINEVIERRVVEKHFSEYQVLAQKLDDIGEQFFPGYRIQMVLMDDILKGSEGNTELLSGKSVKNPHTDILKQTREYMHLDSASSVPNVVEKELLFYNYIVTKYTKERVDILSSNIFIAFNTEEIKNYRDSLTKNLVFVNMNNNTTCFASWEDMRNWVGNNSKYIYEVIDTLKNARDGNVILPKESTLLYDYFTVFKRPLFDHVGALSVGSTFDEVESNKNRQKLYAGMENILERQLGNK